MFVCSVESLLQISVPIFHDKIDISEEEFYFVCGFYALHGEQTKRLCCSHKFIFLKLTPILMEPNSTVSTQLFSVSRLFFKKILNRCIDVPWAGKFQE